MYPIYVSHICIPEGIHIWDIYMHPIGIHICIPYMYHICIDGIRIWDTYMDAYVYGIHVWINIHVILKKGDIYGY